MSSFVFYIVRTFWVMLSWLPLKVLFFFSDVIFYIIYYVVRYRRKVVRRNMVNSFPEKTETEIVELEKRFYHALCDYFMETMKLYGMSEEKARKRVRFEGIDEVNRAFERGQSVVVYMGHTFNWEYATTIPLWLDRDNLTVGHIYHPLENEKFDDFFKKLRGQFNSENIAMKATLRRIIELGKQNRQFVIGFIADQVPTWESIHHWVNFMNQDTPVFTGTEKIAQRTKSAVFYMHIVKVKRGRYIARFEHMVDDASMLAPNLLTEMYYKTLEDSIRKQPEMWLWTHNRWKRTRQGQIERERRRVEERRKLAAREQRLSKNG